MRSTSDTENSTRRDNLTSTSRYLLPTAAAPTWTILLVSIPLAGAIYIGTSRYFDFYHDGYDILSGTAIGLVSAWIGFRWYHAPLGSSAGWASSMRSGERAFGIGVGTLGYVVKPFEGPRLRDVELGSVGASRQVRPAQQRRVDIVGDEEIGRTRI